MNLSAQGRPHKRQKFSQGYANGNEIINKIAIDNWNDILKLLGKASLLALSRVCKMFYSELVYRHIVSLYQIHRGPPEKFYRFINTDEQQEYTTWSSFYIIKHLCTSWHCNPNNYMDIEIGYLVNRYPPLPSPGAYLDDEQFPYKRMRKHLAIFNSLYQGRMHSSRHAFYCIRIIDLVEVLEERLFNLGCLDLGSVDWPSFYTRQQWTEVIEDIKWELCPLVERIEIGLKILNVQTNFINAFCKLWDYHSKFD